MTNRSAVDIADTPSQPRATGQTRCAWDGICIPSGTTTETPARRAIEESEQPASLGASPPRRARLQGGGWAVDAEDVAEGVADLADGRHVAERLAHGDQQVVGAHGGVVQVAEGGADGGGVALGADLRERLGLRLGDRRVELQQRDRLLFALRVTVHADHDPVARLDRLELGVGGALDLFLLEAPLDRGDRPAEAV